MRKAMWLWVGLVVLALAVGLCGCGGMNEVTGTGADTAGKPPAGGLPAHPFLSGPVFFTDDSDRFVKRLDWNATSYNVIPLPRPNGGASLAGVVTPPSGGRYIVYKVLTTGPMYNYYAMRENWQSGDPYFNVTPEPSQWTTGLVVSPDGQRVAWDERQPVNDLSDPAQPHLYVADLVFDPASGLPCGVDMDTRIEVSNRTTTAAQMPHWSPDGTRLAVSVAGGIGVVAVSPHAPPTIVVPAPARVHEVAWAPGPRIAYSEEVLNAKGTLIPVDIRTASPDGPGDVVVVTSKTNASTSWNDCPAYSPDGSQIAFRARTNLSGDRAVHRTTADGRSAVTAITQPLGTSILDLIWAK